jgi:hypothetical protein
MKKYSLAITLSFIFFFLFNGCGSSKKEEENLPEKKNIPADTTELQKPPEGKFDMTERFIVSNSSISLDHNDMGIYEDPVIGEFIKLKIGNRYSVIFHQFENDTANNEKISEVVFAVEVSNLETNIKYFPEKFVYYFLHYSREKSRIDGKTIRGYLIFNRINENYAYGNIDFQIGGIKKAFDQEDIEVEVLFKGSFKLPITDLRTIKR